MKNPFKTFYDPVTDTIHGTEEGTLSWYHEDRHRQQYKKGTAPLFVMWSDCALLATVWLMVFDMIPFAKICIVITMLLRLWLEIDAWIYSIKMKLNQA